MNTFCILPWVHLSISNSGYYQHCCKSIDDETHNINTSSFKEFMLSESNKQLRQDMLNGIWSKKCERCRFDEMHTNKSKRLLENKKHLPLTHDFVFSVDDYYKPISLDIRAGNLCNLKCKMCNPTSSSLVAKEENNNADYLVDFDITSIKDLIPNTRELLITGGEPTVVDGVDDLISFCIENDYAKNIHFKTTINGTTLPVNFTKRLKEFNTALISVSIDGPGKVNQYIRWPSEWNKIEKNLKTLYNISNKNELFKVNVFVTAQVLNVLYLPKLLEWLENNCPGIEVVFNLLYTPKVYSMYMLPLDVRKEIVDRLDKTWNLTFTRLEYFKDMLLVDKPNYSKDYIEKFWIKSNLQDANRNCKLEDYLPEVYEILKGIK